MELFDAPEHGQGGTVVGAQGDVRGPVIGDGVQDGAHMEHIVHALHAPAEQVIVHQVAPDDFDIVAVGGQLLIVHLTGPGQDPQFKLVRVLHELFHGLRAHHAGGAGEKYDFFHKGVSFRTVIGFLFSYC